MKMKRLLLSFGLVSLALMDVACPETDESSNVVHGVSLLALGCLGTEELLADQYFVISPEEASDLGSLHCVAWQYDEGAGSLKIDLVNQHGECRLDFQAITSLESSELLITLRTSDVDGECSWAGCDCLNNFAIELSHVVASQVGSLRVRWDPCDEEAFEDLLERPLDLVGEPNGLWCELQRSSTDSNVACGQRFGECRGTGAFCSATGDGSACAAGATCTEIEGGWSACLPDCGEASPCDPDATLACEAGVCVVR